MALQSCYECNKKISTKALMCPQCGAPQNPISGLVDKAKDGFLGKTFNKVKNNIKQVAANKIVTRRIEEDLERVVQREIIDEHAAIMQEALKVSKQDGTSFVDTLNSKLKLYIFPRLHSLLTGSRPMPMFPLAPVPVSTNEIIRDNCPSAVFEREANKEFEVLMEMMEIPSGHDWWEKLIWMKLEYIRGKIAES